MKRQKDKMERVDISQSEKHVVEYMQDFYSVIVAIEKLEKANQRDLIVGEQYESALKRLLEKYNRQLAQLKASDIPMFTSGPTLFWNTYCKKCSAAKVRVEKGHPADEKEKANTSGRVDPKFVLEAGQHFITLMDCLKLQQTAVDQLFPILTDLVNSVEKVSSSFDFLPKLQGWKKRLDTMHPSDELSERDTREFAFDLDRGYQSFYRYFDEKVQSTPKPS